MDTESIRPDSLPSKQKPLPSHQFANKANWWLDFWTMAGKKTENQDSVLITNCLMHEDWQKSAPLLVLLADGVSACQFPKQASRIAVETVAQTVVDHLADLLEPKGGSKEVLQNGAGLLNDEQVAVMLKIAVNKANDSMYFSQSYQRVPPLLSTLSGLLCIDDRIHLFHTGDSRIYRMGVDDLTVLSEDHRINRGQDKGALSAALGADTKVHIQQEVFTLHQNEYLAIMTDGVHEFVEQTDMQYEVKHAFKQLESALEKGDIKYGEASLTHYLNEWHFSRQICEYAYEQGSNDNLSMITLGMLMPMSNMTPQNDDNSEEFIHTSKQQELDTQRIAAAQAESLDAADMQVINPVTKPIHTQALTYKIPSGLIEGDEIDGFTVTSIIARTARSEVYLVVDEAGHEYVLKSPSLSTVEDGTYIREFLKERKIGLSLSKNRRAGEAAYNQTNPNKPVINNINDSKVDQTKSVLNDSGLLRYYPVPASSVYLYHLTEFIEGESLRMFMERNGACDVWQTHDLLTKIGMAVRVMHRHYLLHQDIKPENILLTKSGAVKLIDFGSASSSILKDSARPPVGDLHYAAPEYYNDAPKGVHSDLFSIAVIGFELLAGERPFTSQELMSPNSELRVPTELLRQKQVPFSSQQALLRGMHRNSNVRYQAIGEFLQEFNPDNMVSTNDPEPLMKRNPLLVWHGICLIQAIIIVFLLVTYL